MNDNFKYLSLDDLIALGRVQSRSALRSTKISRGYQNPTSGSSSNDSLGLWIFIILMTVLIVVGFIIDSKYNSAEKMYERYKRSRGKT